MKSLAVGGHPLIPCEGLTPLGDVREVAVEPAARWGTGKSPEWRSCVKDLVFEEGKGDDEERDNKNPERKRGEHIGSLCWSKTGGRRGIYALS